MKREDFLEAARTLASEHGLGIVDCLRKRGWAIATEVADDLDIHVSTASKDLSSLHECGLLERRKAGRKTRPAYEYRLRGERIILELDLAEFAEDSREELAEFCKSFFEKLFLKANRMGWQSLESEVLRELGDGGERLCDAIALELGLTGGSGKVSDTRSAFARLLERIRGVFVMHLGESATARILEATAREEAESHPSICAKYRLLADIGVKHGF